VRCAELIVGQWLAVILLAGGMRGIWSGWRFEAGLMIRLLAPVSAGGAACPPATWPWLWAIGALLMISLLVGLRPYRQLLATQPLRVLRRDVVANVWPLRYFLPVTVR
jgi:putative ABC transport system permease protein